MKTNEINIVSKEFMIFMKDFFENHIEDILINNYDSTEMQINYGKGIFNIGNGLIIKLSNAKTYKFDHGYNNNQYAIRLSKEEKNLKLNYKSIKTIPNYKLLEKIIGTKIKTIKPETQIAFRDPPQLRSIKFYSNGFSFAIIGEDNFKTSDSEDSYVVDGCWIVVDEKISQFI